MLPGVCPECLGNVSELRSKKKKSVELFVPLFFLTAGQAVLAEGMSGTRAFGWHTLSLTVKVSTDCKVSV